MHTRTRRVGDDYIRTPVLVDKVLCQHVLHVAGKKQRVPDAVDFRVDLGVLDGFGHIFDADDLARLSGHEVGDGSRAGIKVVNQLVAGEPCEVAGHFVQSVCLLGVGLVERLGTHLEAQAFHLLEDMVFAFERVHVEVGNGVVALIINNV